MKQVCMSMMDTLNQLNNAQHSHPKLIKGMYPLIRKEFNHWKIMKINLRKALENHEDQFTERTQSLENHGD